MTASNPRPCRVELQFPKIVQDVEASPAQPYDLSIRIIFCPFAGIDVSSDCGDRGNPTQPLDWGVA
jgi:hypothetical protein